MRTLISVALLVFAVDAPVAPADVATKPPRSDQITVAGPGTFGLECIAGSWRRGLVLLDSHHGTNLGDGRARIIRRNWQAIPVDDQDSIIWALAFDASCVQLKPMTLEVRIVDEFGSLLRRQLISTSPECHGDRIGGSPETPWYRC